MLIQQTIVFAAIISIPCMVLPSRGGSTSVRVRFAETDAKASEDDLFIRVAVEVEGGRDPQGHNLTLTAMPLTVAQYMDELGKYGNSCLSVITHSVDPAEEKDFSRAPVETVVTPDPHVYQESHFHEIHFNVSLFDDSIEESNEYFLLVLDDQQSDGIEYDKQRQCVRLTIIADEDSCELLYDQADMLEVRENTGEIELFRVSKLGQTESPVTIYISGNSTGNLMILSSTITLQPNETSATVNAIIIDDQFPEDDFTYHIHMNSDHGSQTINITILDDDYVEIGFDKTEVTVIEGETVLLSASFKNNISSMDYGGSGFSVFISDEGNVTGRASKVNNLTYLKQFHPESGNSMIKIQTVNNNIIEGNRHLEVRLVDLTPNKFTKIDPDRVIVTVRDNDGLPNQPTIGDIIFNDGTITLTWTVSRNELQPIQKYTITIDITRSRNLVSKPNRARRQVDEDEVHQINVNLADIQCKFDSLSMINHCEYTIQQDIKQGKTYNITLCAENEFGKTCQSSGSITPPPTAAPVDQEENGLPMSIILGVVISVLVAVLLFSLLLICFTLLKRMKKAKERKKAKETNQEDDERYTYFEGNQHSGLQNESPHAYDIVY